MVATPPPPTQRAHRRPSLQPKDCAEAAHLRGLHVECLHEAVRGECLGRLAVPGGVSGAVSAPRVSLFLGRSQDLGFGRGADGVRVHVRTRSVFSSFFLLGKFQIMLFISYFLFGCC